MSLIIKATQNLPSQYDRYSTQDSHMSALGLHAVLALLLFSVSRPACVLSVVFG